MLEHDLAADVSAQRLGDGPIPDRVHRDLEAAIVQRADERVDLGLRAMEDAVIVRALIWLRHRGGTAAQRAIGEELHGPDAYPGAAGRRRDAVGEPRRAPVVMGHGDHIAWQAAARVVAADAEGGAGALMNAEVTGPDEDLGLWYRASELSKFEVSPRSCALLDSLDRGR